MNGAGAPQPHVNLAELQSQENRMLSFLVGRIPCKHMIDVGAHHGSVLEPFLSAGWRVDAFEPMKENRDVTISKFGDRQKFNVFGEALSNTIGEKELHVALNVDGTLHEFYHTFENLPEDEYHRKGPVRLVSTTTLDRLISDGKIDGTAGFLKIDTEGHDLMVLEGAATLKCDVVSVEFWCEGHPFGKSPSPPEEMIKLMRERGFRYYIAVSHGPEGDVFHYSSQRFSRGSWGNLFFYRADLKELYEECVQLCSLISGRERSLYKMFSLLREILPPDLTFVDVGAFRGEFSAFLLEVFPQAKAMLFEPTGDSFERLKQRFMGNERIQIFNIALEKEEGTKPFFTFEKSENNSLLKAHSEESGFTQKVAQVATLDGVLRRQGSELNIGILKTDTQGCDLRVLEGSSQTIRKHRPILYTEVTFIPQYQDQDDYFHVLKFMAEHEYRLSGIYNAHQTSDGLVAFADFLFLPAEMHSKICESGISEQFTCSDSGHLIEQNRFLESTCQEQSRLIDELKEASEERAKAVLEKEAERVATHEAAQERARQLIEKEREISSTQNVAQERARQLIEKEAEISTTQNVAQERARQLIKKETEISTTQNVAQERARQLIEKETEISTTQKVAQERARQLIEKEEMINELHRIADERSRVIHLINEELETIKRHWAYRSAAKIKRALKAIGILH